jgi:hypothetical protein
MASRGKGKPALVCNLHLAPEENEVRLVAQCLDLNLKPLRQGKVIRIHTRDTLTAGQCQAAL